MCCCWFDGWTSGFDWIVFRSTSLTRTSFILSLQVERYTKIFVLYIACEVEVVASLTEIPHIVFAEKLAFKAFTCRWCCFNPLCLTGLPEVGGREGI